MLIEIVGDNLVEGGVGMTRKDVSVVWLKHLIECLGISCNAGNIVVAECLAVLLVASGRNVEHNKDGLSLGNIAQVLLQPSVLLLINITDIEPIATDIEVIIQDYIVHIAHIERVVGRTESLLPQTRRGLVSAAIECHIVVARGAEIVNARGSHSSVVLSVEGVVVRDDVATADTVEWNVVALDGFADIACTISECRELLLMPNLGVSDDNEAVVSIILLLLQ